MITLQKAKLAVEASEKKATELGIAVTTTIVDEHGTVIAVSRMDGAFTVSPDFSFSKAFTSAALGFNSADLEPYAAEGKPYFGINTLMHGKLTTIAGGLPIVIDGKREGAVGVGGSTNTQEDVACAQEAVNVLIG